MRRNIFDSSAMRLVPTAGALCLLTSLSVQPAHAEDDAWTFRVLPYIWAAGQAGDVATLPGLPPASIDLSFSDILENLDIAAFLVADAEYGDLFLTGEIAYASISSGASTPGGAFSGGELTSKTLRGLAAVGYTVSRGEAHKLGVFGGLRIWNVDTKLALRTGGLPGVTIKDSETFADPVIGMRGSYRFAPKWSIDGSGSVGGFGIGADLEFGATATLTYAAGETWNVVAGYRYLSVNYDNNGFLFDVDQQGPVIGVTFTF